MSTNPTNREDREKLLSQGDLYSDGILERRRAKGPGFDINCYGQVEVLTDVCRKASRRIGNALELPVDCREPVLNQVRTELDAAVANAEADS